ncbi:hypothetical protein [Flavobacterium sp. TAB 87]|uniref:hypothetical protein n=1 Tax=Flavobacterium sp. TAB 87 TaxID=1729581 RepID=UPI00083669B5|nr:hypothetical protein [Flavobacterium sp. TAB 87]
MPKVFDKNFDKLVVTKRITCIDKRHRAFTDLVYFDNRWLLTYRESNEHIFGEDGVAKILSSLNADDWELVKLYKYQGFDFRDPKFAIKDNKLLFYTHGSTYLEAYRSAPKEYKDFRAKYTGDGNWSLLNEVFVDKKNGTISNLKGNETYPWRVTYYKGIGYVFGYNFQHDVFNFYTTEDDVYFKNTNTLKSPTGTPNEATVRVDENGVFYSLVRREYATALLGKSKDLGLTWNWFGNIPIYAFGGPNFLFYKDGILLSGREKEKLILGYFDLKTGDYKKILTFESGGDCSYPGMVITDNFLWISYYSQHEQKRGSSIYLSRINLSKLGL